jgi:hypothetical protein
MKRLTLAAAVLFSVLTLWAQTAAAMPQSAGAHTKQHNKHNKKHHHHHHNQQ